MPKQRRIVVDVDESFFRKIKLFSARNDVSIKQMVLIGLNGLFQDEERIDYQRKK